MSFIVGELFDNVRDPPLTSPTGLLDPWKFVRKRPYTELILRRVSTSILIVC